MRNLPKAILAGLVLVAAQAMAEEASLETQLDSLNMPETGASKSTLPEKYYAVQSRSVPLRHAFEIGMGYGNNLTSNSFLNSEQYSGYLQYHFNDNWSIAVGKSEISNRFTSSADGVVRTQGAMPDVGWAIDRTEARIEYNLFYGKFRMTRDTVWYFDYYLGAGYAQTTLNSGTSDGPVVDTGLVLWFKHVAMRAGFKDYYYEEQRILTKEMTHNVHAHTSIAYLF